MGDTLHCRDSAGEPVGGMGLEMRPLFLLLPGRQSSALSVVPSVCSPVGSHSSPGNGLCKTSLPPSEGFLCPCLGRP